MRRYIKETHLSAGGVEPMASCQFYKIKDLPQSVIYFTRLWTDSQTRGRVIQSASSSHTMGAGYSASGDYGSFGASGTQTKTSGTGYDTGFTIWNSAIGNKWLYGLYGRKCDGSWTPGSFTFPIRATAGPYTTGTAAVGWCVNSTPYKAGWTFDRYANKSGSVTWTGNIMGAHMSAQSGWATTQRIQYHFYYSGRMCSGSSAGIFDAYNVRADR
ncbi:hypothetical protein VV02_11035 [Luteipulveratus mongoliensis]|uniref:Uncharacterized protein n=2 Tax=Luteipulveratus mongoliensis TaxID=571913 RepID=A0A0K1JI67_9MICO|nr:hypothetical protein VV02_11035 [Luteipulveratus mongoliensis]